MIRAAAASAALLQRLRNRAARIAEARRAQSVTRTDWHSAVALWPDLFGDRSDGK